MKITVLPPLRQAEANAQIRREPNYGSSAYKIQRKGKKSAIVHLDSGEAPEIPAKWRTLRSLAGTNVWYAPCVVTDFEDNMTPIELGEATFQLYTNGVH